MATPDRPRRCRFCTLMRRTGQAVSLLLLPRVFALLCAAGIVLLMAPSGLPRSVLVPPKPAPVAAPGAAASAGSAAAAASVPADLAAAITAAVRQGLAQAIEQAASAAAVQAVDAALSRAASAAATAAVTAATASAAQPAASAASAPAPAPLVRFAPRTLPSARVGMAWGPVAILEPDSPPVQLGFSAAPPDWIKLRPDGTLQGTPPAAAKIGFTVRATSRADPKRFVEQAFSLQVHAPRPPRASQPPTLQAAQLVVVPDADPTAPRSYRLDEADIEALTDPTLPSDADWAAVYDHKPRALPTQDQLGQMLAPLKGVDFPNESSFRASLRLSSCALFNAAFRQQLGAPPSADPLPQARSAIAAHCEGPLPALPGADDAEPLTKLPPEMSLDEFYKALLPVSLQLDIIRRARKLHQPLASDWVPAADCNCAPEPRQAATELYAWATAWGSPTQQAAAAQRARAAAEAPAGAAPAAPAPRATRALDFGVYTRVSYFGAVLQGLDGNVELTMPAEVREQGMALSRLARQYANKVDLVVYRRDWQALLALDGPQQARFQRNAADEIMRAVDSPDRTSAWQQLLPPFWREPALPYDGVTLFFDDAPLTIGPGPDRFGPFLQGLATQLIAAMQRSGRAYRLNIVLPAEAMVEEGSYSFTRMMQIVALAERDRNSKQVDERPTIPLVGTTDIEVYFVPLLPERTTDSKKSLRERLDESQQIKGADRVYLLRSTLPMLLRPTAAQPPWAKQSPDAQFKDDLAYMKWNFGGTVLWDAPGDSAEAALMPGLSPGYTRAAATDDASATGVAAQDPVDRLCAWVCPYRMAWRGALQALLVLGLVSFGVWLYSCAVHRMRRRLQAGFKALLWGQAAVIVGVAAALLVCDPSLAVLRANNDVLAAVIALLFGAGIYWTFRPRHAPP